MQRQTPRCGVGYSVGEWVTHQYHVHLVSFSNFGKFRFPDQCVCVHQSVHTKEALPKAVGSVSRAV